jgi:hypothetical protein
MAGNPDVAATVPTMKAGDPDPVAVCRRRYRNNFHRPGRRRSDANDQLSIRRAGGEEKGGGRGEKSLFHVHFLAPCFPSIV